MKQVKFKLKKTTDKAEIIIEAETITEAIFKGKTFAKETPYTVTTMYKKNQKQQWTKI